MRARCASEWGWCAHATIHERSVQRQPGPVYHFVGALVRAKDAKTRELGEKTRARARAAIVRKTDNSWLCACVCVRVCIYAPRVRMVVVGGRRSRARQLLHIVVVVVVVARHDYVHTPTIIRMCARGQHTHTHSTHWWASRVATNQSIGTGLRTFLHD